MTTPTPEQVLGYTRATEEFLCPHSANTYGLEFVEFRVRDMDSGATLFHMQKPEGLELPPPADDNDDTGRFIAYNFGAGFLRARAIGAALKFSVGPEPVPNFRMIERHYFGDKLLKSFDFKFGFCIPGSTNEWEIIYEMPELTDEEESAMIAAPYATKSDSFYFVDDILIMHNKAEYAFLPEDAQPSSS